jgi:hypothetical protein
MIDLNSRVESPYVDEQDEHKREFIGQFSTTLTTT